MKGISMSYAKKVAQKGFSMIEIGIVMVIVAGLVAVVYQKAAEMKTENRGQQMIALHKELSDNVSRYFEPDFNYTGLNTAAVFNAQLNPKAMRSVSGELGTPYGSATGNVSVTSGRTDLFDIVYTNMPMERCGKDVAAMASGAVRVDVEGTSIMNLAPDTGDAPVQMDKILLATACSGATDYYTVTFTMQ